MGGAPPGCRAGHLRGIDADNIHSVFGWCSLNKCTSIDDTALLALSGVTFVLVQTLLVEKMYCVSGVFDLGCGLLTDSFWPCFAWVVILALVFPGEEHLGYKWTMMSSGLAGCFTVSRHVCHFSSLDLVLWLSLFGGVCCLCPGLFFLGSSRWLLFD